MQARNSRVNQLWQVNCDRLSVFDAALLAKDQEIALLRQMLTEQSPLLPVLATPSVPDTDVRATTPVITTPPKARNGKAPSVELFTGEDREMCLDDWLPSLHRASQWNRWSGEEQLIQLSGHLRGRALQE